MNEMNFAPTNGQSDSSVREGLVNGTSAPCAKNPPLPTASVSTMEKDSTIKRGNNGNLPSVHHSPQQQQLMTSPGRERYIRENRIGMDGSFSPQREPQRLPDGSFARPRGRCPSGFRWDADRGVYAPDPLACVDTNGDGMYKTNGISDSYKTSSSARTGAISDGSDGKKQRLSPLASSAASVETSASDTNQASGANHGTRSKGSSRKSSGCRSETVYSSGERIAVQKSSSERSMNECATLLARLDDTSYKGAILQDATSILERILFPMSFPWNHSIVPAIKNFPKDIDELPAILQADDDEYTPFDNGLYGYGGFEVGKDRRTAHEAAALAHGETYLAATRRTDDVGVIELTVIDNDHVIGDSSLLRKRKIHEVHEAVDSAARNEVSISLTPHSIPSRNFTDRGSSPKDGMASCSVHGADTANDSKQGGDDTSANEDYVFQAFEHAKAVKKQKVKTCEDNVQRVLVSVRFGSVSSRSSLFTAFGEKKGTTPKPLLCEAVMHSRRNRNNAVGYGTDEWDPDRAKFLKRDNLAWTQSIAGGSLSKLTYNTMPSVGAKKPREVRVGVRLNGELLTYPPGKEMESPQAVVESILVSQVPVGVDTADSDTTSQDYTQSGMCMLDCDKLMHLFVRRHYVRESKPKKLPRLDVVPLALCGGSTRVVCTSPGTLIRTNVSDLFRSDDRTCSVCWTSEGDIKQCTKCGLQVHTSCCAHDGVHLPSNNTSTEGMSWMCAVCCEGPKQKSTNPSPRRRTSNIPMRYQSNVLLGVDLQYGTPTADEGLKCCLCPHSGGAMSPAGGSDWSHEVCRLWTQASVEQESTMPRIMSKCALCGMDGTLIKCAGSDCTVRFHPMCALISVMQDTNLYGDIPPDDTATQTLRDERLCGRFTLDILECGESLVPVGFCGFHNQARAKYLYGCYPAGMGTAMRVPPVMTEESSTMNA